MNQSFQQPQWTPNSWQDFPVSQQASYPDQAALNDVLSELSSLPPLVIPQEVEALKSKLACAAKGDAFILQGGDCAELFAYCNPESIGNKLNILEQMTLMLTHSLKKPVIKIGRMAGQYAKPRSSETETIDGQSLPSYRGDLINGPEFNAKDRIPDPRRLLKGYSFASLTINYLRTLQENKYQDICNVDNWDLDFIDCSPMAEQYKNIISQIKQAITFIENIANNGNHIHVDNRFYIGHEALHLHYEQALTRQSSNGNWYNLSTHLPWIGMRTAQLDSAHMEYMSGISNPVAVKISQNMTPEQLIKVCDKLDPDNELGRLVLITRMGEQNVDDYLPALIKAVKSENRTPLWCCDPMHGNTSVTSNGTKTRRFDAILGELSKAFLIHQQHDSHLGGVHFELTGENVTECIGGARELSEHDLHRAYKSLVDPRLNAEQALEMTLQIIELNQSMDISVNNNKNLVNSKIT